MGSPTVKRIAKSEKIPSLNEENQLLQQVLSGSSISKPKVQEEKKADEMPPEVLPNYNEIADRPFSQEELKVCWLQYAERQKENEPRLYSILYSNVPEANNSGALLFRLANKSQEAHINEIKPRLVAFLRKELQNSTIDIELEVVESVSTENKLYTIKDKLDFLMQKNPALARMKKEMTLDFD